MSAGVPGVGGTPITGGVPGVGGTPVLVPARHALASGCAAALLLPAGRLITLLPPGWRPAVLGAGQSVLAVAYHDFAATPVGPYRQVSLAVPVHVGRGGRAARGWPLLPILWQSLGGARDLFPTLGLCVVLLVATTREAVAYSREIWGEPAFPGAVEVAPEEGAALRGRSCGPAAALPRGTAGMILTARAEGGHEVEMRLPVCLPCGDDVRPGGESMPPGRPGVLSGRENRRYRLFSRLADAALTDCMHVRAPCGRTFSPRRGRLRWRAPGDIILEERPWCLMGTVYGRGEIVFAGPTRL